ncbi:MAG: UDP-glucose--hexose-1-phosphate uridylyltransferase [Eubacteriaceae bacterium]|jgi:UDPglucose--hexose-1-phosphate uridylyltransferase
MESIEKRLGELVNYCIGTGLIGEEDRIWAFNSLNLLFGTEPDPQEITEEVPLENILPDLVDWAVAHGLCGGSQTERDLFDTKIMGLMTPRPSDVIGKFEKLYSEDPRKATDWYYQFSQDTNYIRRDRIRKDLKWETQTQYGPLEITINLSKPEKDPKAIAAAGKARQTGYPKCQLCAENEGYAGRLDHPARENHRIIPIEIDHSKWFLQYSPYVYYNEHCIVLNSVHQPMKIDRSAFNKLFDFVTLFPHYFVGSNADLPIVGGSILSHEHFQGGGHEFPMAQAREIPVDDLFPVDGVQVSRLHWPMSVIRLRGADREKLTDTADQILKSWREYSDPSADVFAFTGDTPHNTITPIVRRRGGDYEIDLVLRNNRTTADHPLGLFHPHEEYHHIKKENIGLIEVMGLAVLPARLRKEIEMIQEVLIHDTDTADIPELAIHEDWIEELRGKYPEFTDLNTSLILEKEVGLVFEKVLENAGVFKNTPEGIDAFERFIASAACPERSELAV